MKFQKRSNVIVEGEKLAFMYVKHKDKVLTCIIDKEDAIQIKHMYWFAIPKGSTYYVESYPTTPKPRRRIKLHRLLLSATVGSIVDHSDGDGLNNSKKNIRLCSFAENSRNKKSDSNKMFCKFKGVSNSYSSLNPFRSSLHLNGKRVSLGCFSTAEESAKAYNEAALKYFGEFARLNIIPDVTSIDGINH